MYLCDFTGEVNRLSENCSQLEYLFFVGELITFKNIFVKTFPKLNDIEISDGNGTIEFGTFLQLNPQLMRVSASLNDTFQLNHTSISAIVTHLPHFKALKLRCNFPHGYVKTRQGENSDEIRITPLLKALENANIWLESLVLSGFEIDPIIIQTIVNFKTINTLCLIYINGVNSGIDLIPLATRLTSLKRIYISAAHGNGDVQISAFTVAIRNANVLIEEINFERINIDSMAIKSLLNLKSLKKLRLWINESFREQYLVLLVNELTQLIDLQVGGYFNSSVKISEYIIIKTVQSGKRLRTFSVIDLAYIHFNKNVIDSLINAAKCGETNRELTIYISAENVSRERGTKSKFEIQSNHGHLENFNMMTFMSVLFL